MNYRFDQRLITASVVIVSIALGGCASMSNRTKTLITMAGTGIIVGTIAANKAPIDENPLAHAAVWGGTSAAVAGAISLYVFDEQKKSEELERKLGVAQRELDSLRGEGPGLSQIPIAQSDSSFAKDIPAEYRSLVRPGGWSLYKINNWIVQGENTLIHQDKLLRITPPHFQPQTNQEGEGK